MSKLTQATARRQMWEERWNKAGRPVKGALWAAYNKACDREMDLILKGIDTRAEAARVKSWVDGKELCPDVLTGCNHGLVMSAEGLVVACFID